MNFAFKLITPEKVFFSGEATMVTAPGEEGEFGVLAGHSPLISTLKPGIVVVENGATVQKIAVMDGVAEVNETSCTVLAEHAYDLATLSKPQIEEQLGELKDALEDANDVQKIVILKKISMFDQALNAIAA